MEEPTFSAPDFKVNISGSDYMKYLADAQFQELDATYSNYWGASLPYTSWPSDGVMATEIYTENDAMNTAIEVGGIGTWTTSGCAFAHMVPGGAPSVNVGRVSNTVTDPCYVRNTDVGAGAVGTQYRLKFYHHWFTGDGTKAISLRIYQTLGLIKTIAYFPINAWTEETVYFTAIDNTAIQLYLYVDLDIDDLRIDHISIRAYTPPAERFYQLPGASNGPYHVMLDDDGAGAVKVEQGEEDEGWYHEESTKRVFFDRNKVVAERANAVEVFYFTDTDPEDAVARILYFAKVPHPVTGLPYVDEAAAKLAMDNDDPGFAIEKVWFKAGTTFLSAIRMLCERCNYRFWFKYNGQPAFKSAPAPGAPVFKFTSAGHIASARTYQDQNEIKNTVIIKGIKQAEPINREESVPSELVGEASDAGSIAAYGERTMTITNHLFQTQAAINAMCVILRDLYMTPEWYCDLVVPFNPVPLELGDNIQWEERLAHGLDWTQTGIIRDIKITNFTTTYRVVKT